MGEIARMMMGGGEKVITLDDCTISGNIVNFPHGVTWGDIKQFSASAASYYGGVASFAKINGELKFLQGADLSGNLIWSYQINNITPQNADTSVSLYCGSHNGLPASLVAVLT